MDLGAFLKRAIRGDHGQHGPREVDPLIGLLPREIRLKETADDVRSAVIYTKPKTIFEPDFSWKKTDQWINFAWSVLPVITADGSFKEGS